MMRHQDRVFIVTGAARGLGCACAERLASEGGFVALADVDADALATVSRRLSSSGFENIAVSADVSSEESVRALAAQVLEHWGRIDGLVANAALANSVGGATYDQISVEQWDRIMDVNVRGTWLTCRAVAPHMQARRKGSIVTLGSDTSLWGSPRLLHYVTSKGAVEAFTRAMSRELGAENVRINCIAPGLLDNEATAGVPAAKRQWNIQNRAIPREGTVQDIVGLVSFLLSDDASFITGQLIVADGGLVLH